MFLPVSIKIFVGFAVLFASSCSFWQGAEKQNANALSAPFIAEESKSAIPFSTKEPDVYQAEIVLTNYAGGEKSERKIFTARRGAKLRCDYENKISFLQTGENQKFSIDNGKKIYAESPTNSDIEGETGNGIKDFLTAEWLNAKRGATFKNLGAENNLTKYLVTPEDAPNAASETLIFVDENLKIPVRQEFYTTGGGQKILVFSMELRNLKLEADDKLFELPKDFRKVSMKEFQKTIWLEKFNPKND
jgi:outer membrane lipoprotein-sorting protein